MKKYLFLSGLILLILLIGCTSELQTENDVLETVPDRLLNDNNNNEPTADNDPQTAVESNSAVDWQNIELNDINSGKKFKISDFRGKKVLLESFAVWCPICTNQQKNIKLLHDDVGDSIISISLDTDPNEDEEAIKAHAQSNGFDWRYAIAPVNLGQALVDEFGIGVVNAPSAPVIMICEDGGTRLMKRGLKSVSDLQEEIVQGC